METKTAPKKGNKTTEIILGAAASRMEAAVKSLLAVAPEINKLQETANTTMLEVVNLEDKIGGLKQDYSNKVAQNKIEIEQAFNTDQKAFVDKWLNDNSMTVIEQDELDELKNDLEEATTKMEENVKKAVGIATSSLQKDHTNALAVSKLEFEKKEANNTAELAQSKNQITFLEGQITSMRKMIEDMQKNETERAKYGQVGTINVGNPQR